MGCMDQMSSRSDSGSVVYGMTSSNCVCTKEMGWLRRERSYLTRRRVETGQTIKP